MKKIYSFLLIGFLSFCVTNNVQASETVINISDLKDNIVDSGDGLYTDGYRENRYVYKGVNPNNYVTFNDEVWRIIAIESDGTLKLIHYGDIGSRPFDEIGFRQDGYCSFTTDSSGNPFGCNVWAKLENLTNGKFTGAVTKDSSLNEYLNGEYYNSIDSKSKTFIQPHNFNFGITKSSDMKHETIINAESTNTWFGNIGLINASDYYLANSNLKECGNPTFHSNRGSLCGATNYLTPTTPDPNETINFYWTMSPSENSVTSVLTVKSNGYVGSNGTSNLSYQVWPVIFIKADTLLKGSGTENDPYTLVKKETKPEEVTQENTKPEVTPTENKKTSTNTPKEKKIVKLDDVPNTSDEITVNDILGFIIINSLIVYAWRKIN